MRRIATFGLVLVLAACSGRNTVRHLQEARWGNSAQPCSENYMTFGGDVIAAHPDGQTLPMFTIRKIKQSWWSPNELSVRIEPTTLAQEQSGLDPDRAQQM